MFRTRHHLKKSKPRSEELYNEHNAAASRPDKLQPVE